MSGLLGSTIIEYNIYSKSFTKNSYSYFDDFERFPRIDENPVFSNIEGEFGNSKLFLHPVSTNGTFDSSHVGTAYQYQYKEIGADGIPFRRAKIMELNNGVNITMKVNGNTTLAAGQTMNLTVPVSGRIHEKDNDEYYSGRYLITQLRHSFYQPDKKHEIIITASKDSLPKEQPTSSEGRPKARDGDTTILNY